MLFNRIVSWLANEFFSKQLARSTTFQRFAVKTHESIQKVSSESARRVEQIKSSGAADVVGEQQAKIKTFGSSFMRHLRKEFKKLEEEGKRK